MTSARRFAGWLAKCVFTVAMVGAATAAGQVFQTDAAKTPLPQPVGTAEHSLVDDSWAWNSQTIINRDKTGANINTPLLYGDYYSPANGYPQFVTGDAITLNGMFKWRGESLDYLKDAKTAPGYFSAKCGFDGQLVLLGGNCQATLGWYNVTDPTSTTPPAAADIHPFIKSPGTSLNCVEQDGVTPKTDGFCPLGWDNLDNRNLSVKRWIPTTFPSGDISTDPNYAGGYVAFAVVGDPNKCPQIKYSMYEHNQRNSSGVPWVTTIIYQSSIDPGGFYMAFEDLPMPQADWKAAGSDGDFNDLVFYVSGLTCAGGNQPCNTGLQGACSVGHTDCAADGAMPVCRSVVQKSVEVCDNVDNDCDGVIDNGDNLCPDPSKPICFQGQCVGTCSTGEFKCSGGLTCDSSGHCSDPACASVTCAAGTACRNGTCVDPCTGVTCPYGTQCELGACVDPCAGVTCPSGRVCEKGLCLGNCSCRGCDTGLTCGSDGKCIDTACANKMCAAGMVCSLGNCIDPCAGVVCPNGGTCTMGTCTAGTGTGPTGSAGGVSLNFGGSGTLSSGGASSTGTGTGTSGSTGRVSGSGDSSKGCGCRVAGQSGTGSTPLALLGSALGLTFLIRRRRRIAA